VTSVGVFCNTPAASVLPEGMNSRRRVNYDDDK
jgi:hypothetical protein